jgi:hypothetical protein
MRGRSARSRSGWPSQQAERPTAAPRQDEHVLAALPDTQRPKHGRRLDRHVTGLHGQALHAQVRELATLLTGRTGELGDDQVAAYGR